MEDVKDIKKAIESLLWFFDRENLESQKKLHTFAAVNLNNYQVKGSGITAGILFLLRYKKRSRENKQDAKTKQKTRIWHTFHKKATMNW